MRRLLLFAVALLQFTCISNCIKVISTEMTLTLNSVLGLAGMSPNHSRQKGKAFRAQVTRGANVRQ